MMKKLSKLPTHINKNKITYIVLSLMIPLFLFTLSSSYPKTTSQHPSTNKSHTPRQTKRPDRVEGQITVKFKTGVTAEQINQVLSKYNAHIIRTLPQIHWLTIQVPEDQTDAVLEKLQNDGLVYKAEPNYISHLMSSPNDPLYLKQWHLKNTGQPVVDPDLPNGANNSGTPGIDIKAEQAWTVTQGNGIRVGVVDTGVNLSHEDLQGKIIASQSFVQGQDVEDQFGHGTITAGIIGAISNNSKGVAGVCPGCQLIIAKVTPGSSSTTADALAQGIMYAADQGAQIINMSFGDEAPAQVEQDAVNYAQGKGAILVASAGNCGAANFSQNGCSVQNEKLYPAAFPGVISVANTDYNDQRNPRSEHGTWVTIAAPGAGIVSTSPNHSFTLMSGGLSMNYAADSGTSFAAPVVSGVLALILSTGVTGDAAIQRLCNTADKISGTGTDWKCGRVNAAAAVTVGSTNPSNAPAPTFTSIGDCMTNGNCLPTPATNPSTIPSSETEPSPTPCVPASNNFIQNTPTHTANYHRHKNRHHHGGDNEGLLAVFIILLQFLLQLLGGHAPAPIDPGASGGPLPSLAPVNPCP